MILYRISIEDEDENDSLLVEWFSGLVKAKQAARELVKTSDCNIYIDKHDMAGRDAVADVMNNSHEVRSLLHGEMVGVIKPKDTEHYEMDDYENILS